jgi:hypothetical protein
MDQATKTVLTSAAGVSVSSPITCSIETPPRNLASSAPEISAQLLSPNAADNPPAAAPISMHGEYPMMPKSKKANRHMSMPPSMLAQKKDLSNEEKRFSAMIEKIKKKDPPPDEEAYVKLIDA